MRKFYPNFWVRFFSGYSIVFILVVLPVLLGVGMAAQGSVIYAVFPWVGIAVPGCILIHIGFWEKCFAHLELSERQIHWKCPFRKDRVISADACVEIGAYMENEENGIPTEQIYFSDHPNPKQSIGKNGVIKASKHLIKFWYSDELCEYLIKTYSGRQTGCLLAYRQRRKRR